MGNGRALLALILSQKFKYNLDLTNINESKLFSLNKNQVFPRTSSIEILNIVEPDTVYLEIENLKKKKVPILPDIQITPIPGYTIINGIQLNPDSVLITGAKAKIDSILFIRTEKVYLKKVKRDIRKKIKLIDPKIKNVWLKQKESNFSADIQKLMEKPLLEIPVHVINKPENVEMTVIPSSLSLTLIGGVDLLLPITNKDIPAYIDYLKIRGSKEKYCLAYIDKPKGVRIKDVKPKRFKVIVKKIR